MSVERSDSFYVTAVSPPLEACKNSSSENGACEFTIPLPYELVFAEHESWYVGVSGFTRQQVDEKKLLVQPRQQRNISMRFWIKEEPFESTDVSASLIVGAKSWGDKIYSITVDTDVVVASVPKGNYTITSFIETLAELFDDGCRRKSIHLRMEIKTLTILIQRTSALSSSHIIEFSNDLVSMLHMMHNKFTITSNMWSTLASYDSKAVALLPAPLATDAVGTFNLPLHQSYYISVSEKPSTSSSAKASEGSTKIERYDIPGGMWTFDLFADYLNSILAAHSVIVTIGQNIQLRSALLSFKMSFTAP